MKNVLVASNLTKIVPSFVIVVVAVLIVFQPVAYGLPNVQDDSCGLPLPSFWVGWAGPVPFTVIRGWSVTLSAEITSFVNKTLSFILILDKTSHESQYVLSYLTCKSQYVTVLPYGTVNNNITISASEDTPLGDYFVNLGGANNESSSLFVRTRIRVIEKIDIPEYPSWVSLVLAFTIPVVIVLVCQRKLTSARNQNYQKP